MSSEADLQKVLKSENKSTTVSVKDGVITFKSRGKDDTFNDIYRLKEKVKTSYLKGIKGITQVLPIKKDEEFIIVTYGTNLKKIMAMPEVDETRSISNDIFEIQNVLGIEASRNSIMNEVFKVIESQGLNVDIRHLMLCADTMCSFGQVRGITRYGVVKEKASVLARASFETPIRHIINASISGEVDRLTSVVENVMLNQPIPVGTGLPQLVAKRRK